MSNNSTFSRQLKFFGVPVSQNNLGRRTFFILYSFWIRDSFSSCSHCEECGRMAMSFFAGGLLYGVTSPESYLTIYIKTLNFFKLFNPVISLVRLYSKEIIRDSMTFVQHSFCKCFEHVLCKCHHNLLFITKNWK